jgi:hypothetical protein
MLIKALSFGIVLFSFLIFQTLHQIGEFRTLEPFGYNDCVLLRDNTYQYRGIEDLTISSDGLCFLSSDPRSLYIQPGVDKQVIFGRPSTPQGDLLLLNLSLPNPVFQRLEVIGYPYPDFHPHGISLTEDGKTLFVVNHRRDGDTVEIFNVQDDPERASQKILRFSFSVGHSELFRNLNDIHAINSTHFYVTNWLYYSEGSLMNSFETLTRRAWGYIIFCFLQGKEFSCRKVAENLPYPNGISLHPDLNHILYVASPISMSIMTFSLSSDFSLSLLESFYVNSGVDNIEIFKSNDGNVSLLVGAHPRLGTFLLHALAPLSTQAPSEV